MKNTKTKFLETLDGFLSEKEVREFCEATNTEDVVESCFEILQRISDAKVTYSMNELCNGMSWISLESERIDFLVPEFITAIAGLASNMEVYPKTNGKVQLNFTFYKET